MIHLNILLAEDDSRLCMVLKAFIDANGHTAKMCADGEEAWKALELDPYDLCLFDISMPKMDGFTLARRVKESYPGMPIIFLTAHKDLDDILEAFAIGADDYITKPFHMEEMLARINAVGRRHYQTNTKPVEFLLGNYKFNAPRHLLTSRDGEEQKLTSKESDLLLMLCECMGETLPRTKALQTIWKEENRTNARSMDVYITKLRKYFADDPNVTIANVHGVGFRLEVH